MAKFQSPLLGYNNNVRHKNRVFHIQTEDSGVNHPHIITHLFMDGGRILKSVKKSYAEHVGSEGMSETVRGMMKEQHKAMFIALRDGQFDHLVGDAPAPVAAPAKAAEPPKSEEAPKTIDESRRPDAAPARASAPAVVAQPPPPSPPSVRPAPAVVLPDPEEVPTTTRQPAPPTMEPAAAAAPALTLDFDALERPSSEDVGGLFQTNDLPPPPKNLFAKEVGTGRYSTVDADAPKESAGRPAEPAAARGAQRSPSSSTAHRSAPGSRPPGSRPSGEGRYAPSRPAAIFGSSTNRPQQPQSSIFGSDELVGDKSLDEVILSYLAEDLEPPRRK